MPIVTFPYVCRQNVRIQASNEKTKINNTRLRAKGAGGKFQCFGSAQHIKNKYGREKYEIEIKIQIPMHKELK